jgi:hypothetical protein
MVKNCEILGGFGVTWDLMSYKHVRCNLDVCPELMSRNQRIVQRGWRILIPHEDKVDVISPINILF